MRTYELVCFDCRESISLGKLVCFDHQMRPIDWKFTGWRDNETGEQISGNSLWHVVERFLILHRIHELRLLPELLVNQIDEDNKLIEFIDSTAQILTKQIMPEPDPETDSQVNETTLALLRKRLRPTSSDVGSGVLNS